MLLLPQLQKSVRGPACALCNLVSCVHTELRLTRALTSATSIDGNSQPSGALNLPVFGMTLCWLKGMLWYRPTGEGSHEG